VVKRFRSYWSAQIAKAEQAGNPILCSKCRQPVLPTHLFDIDHPHPLSKGGDALHLSTQHPAHRACNRADGAQLTNEMRSNRGRRIRRW